MKLSYGERRVLSWLAVEPDTRELDYAKPGGWYMGDTQVDGRICWSLLRKVLISGGTLNGYLPTHDGDMAHYHINEDGQRLLKDPNYVTQFERALTHNAAFQRDLLGLGR